MRILFACLKRGVSEFLSYSKQNTINFLVDMPFGFCTGEKSPWCEFAEDCENGMTAVFIKRVRILCWRFEWNMLKQDFFAANRVVSSASSHGDHFADT